MKFITLTILAGQPVRVNPSYISYYEGHYHNDSTRPTGEQRVPCTRVVLHGGKTILLVRETSKQIDSMIREISSDLRSIFDIVFGKSK